MIKHNKQIEAHIPCRCGESSDAATLYENTEEGYLFIKCYKCNKTYAPPEGTPLHTAPSQSPFREKPVIVTNPNVVEFDFVPHDGFRNRGIRQSTWERYGCTCTEDESNLAFQLRDENGNIVASKVKYKDNKTGEYKYSWNGAKEKSRLFGRHLFKEGGRYVTVTGGYEDAMAVYDMMGDWPSVSVLGGENVAWSETSQDDIRWLSTFDTVVVCFDGDAAGKEGAVKFARSFPTGKAKIVTLGSQKDDKDANAWLKAGRNAEFSKAWWNAPYYKPENIILSSELIGRVSKVNPKPKAYYPFKGLNDALWGLYPSQLVVLTAGSGSGKSALSKAFKLHLFNTLGTSAKFGNLLLEENVDQSAKDYVAQTLGVNINNPEIFENTPMDDIARVEERLFKDNRFLFWDHFGSSDIDTVCETVKYFAYNAGCEYVLLDHISIVVSSQENGDERKALDEVMTKLRKLCQDTGVILFVVSHLKRPNGSDAHEEGGVTSLAQLRGSAGIGQLADVVLGLERNGQHNDPYMRNVSTIRVLKARKTGFTGVASRVLWLPAKASFVDLGDSSTWQENLQEIQRNDLKESLGPSTPATFDNL